MLLLCFTSRRYLIIRLEACNNSSTGAMASATGVPESAQADEQQPLLGDAQTTTQHRHQGLQFNLITGTAIVAQAGIWILAALVDSTGYLHMPTADHLPGLGLRLRARCDLL